MQPVPEDGKGILQPVGEITSDARKGEKKDHENNRKKEGNPHVRTAYDFVDSVGESVLFTSASDCFSRDLLDDCEYFLAVRAAAEGTGRLRRRFAYAGDKLADSEVPCGGDGKDRNAERLGKRGNVDSDILFFRFVHHVQRQHNANARFNQLKRQIKAAVKIGRVRNVDDDVIISAFYVSLGDFFLIPIGREGIAARQVYDIGI